MVIWQHYSSHQRLRQTRHIHTDTNTRTHTGKLIFMDNTDWKKRCIFVKKVDGRRMTNTITLISTSPLVSEQLKDTSDVELMEGKVHPEHFLRQ